jgi:hypothetical protein
MSDYTKQDLAEIKAQIDSWDLAFLKNMGKPITECDENGVVFMRKMSQENSLLPQAGCCSAARLVL